MSDINENDGLNTGAWYEDEGQEENDFQVTEYDITASPNDFNTSTMFSFIESGAVKIPGFQRNFVWDIKRASKLIESIIIGIPIPQLFLYEESRNRFLVIDGQQRLMSIYYFIRQRFPRREKRIEIRRIFDEKGTIPAEVLEDDAYFTKFALQLPEQLPNRPNKLNKLNYGTLGELKTTFDLRTIRNIIIKQTSPDPVDDGSSSIYEIFYRLNTGGVNLKPQEIRGSLFHSSFYDMLHRLNIKPEWRTVIGIDEPDLHMKDIEVLLRGFGMLTDGVNYKPSMTKFLNLCSRRAKTLPPEKVAYLEQLFGAFLAACTGLPALSFYGTASKKFNISMFESVFAAQCEKAFAEKSTSVPAVDDGKISQLKQDPEFVEATQKNTASTTNVEKRLNRAKAILLS